MSAHDDNSAGLPGVERLALGATLKLGMALMGTRRHLKLFAREANHLLEMADTFDHDYASRRARIPRMQGIEADSCHWSLFMVFDHLVQVDGLILQIVRDLHQGLEPLVTVSIADLKPDPDAGAESVAAFETTARQFQATVLERLPLRAEARFPHPWFGPLNARGWVALAATHHRTHRRQARKIITTLGVV